MSGITLYREKKKVLKVDLSFAINQILSPTDSLDNPVTFHWISLPVTSLPEMLRFYRISG